MRIFIALLFPDRIIHELSKMRTVLEELNIQGNFQRNDLLHLTIHYIGETSDDFLKKIISKIKEIDFDSFLVKTGIINFFGSDKVKKVLYLEVEKNPRLLKCYHLVIEKLNELNLNIKQIDYIPHITMVRNAYPVDKEIKELHVKALDIAIDKIHVMVSKRENGNLIYQSLDYVDLK